MLGLMQDKPLLISDLLTYAERYHGDREIVSRDADGALHRYTYADAAVRARRLANALTAREIRPGDRVATLAMNAHRHFELFYGVSGTGAVLHTVNPRLFAEHIVYIVNHAADRLLFVDPAFVPMVAKLAVQLPSIEHCIVLGGPEAAVAAAAAGLPDAVDYESFIAGHPADYRWPTFDERTASSLCYTSGTTGNPKGVLYSHRSTVIHALAASQNGAFGISAFDTVMPIAPMFHANAWSMPYLAPMNGAKLVLPGPRLDGESVQSLIEGEGVSFTVAVPTVLTMLLEHLGHSGRRIDTLKRAAIGGSAVPRAMIETLRDRYGCTILQIWGMTETSPLGTLSTPTPRVAALAADQQQDVLGRQGRVQFGLEVKIVLDDGGEAPRDGRTAGALWVRGPWAAKGYFQSGGDAVLDDDGWFPTGDVATLDELGYLRITDRLKDVIKSGGEWISSIEIENLAYRHPGVRMAAVIAVHHPKWEERPLLVVAPTDGQRPTREGILDVLRPHIAKWWMPDDVVFVDEMPMTATGKIQKLVLRERFRDHILPTAAADGAWGAA